MKRRTLKKQITGLAQQLVTPIRKYLVANARVHQDIPYSYEREIEFGIVDLMRMHLELDPSWPHRKRWLDGVVREILLGKEERNRLWQLRVVLGTLAGGQSGDYRIVFYDRAQALCSSWSGVRFPVRKW